MSEHKRPTKVRRRPAATAPQNVVVVMPKLKWSKLAGYPNGSKNLYHNNATMGLRTVVHLARNQTLQQYFNTYKKFPNGKPIPGYVWNNTPREPGELRRAVRKNATFVLAPGSRTSATKNATFKYFFKYGVFTNKPLIYRGNKAPRKVKPRQPTPGGNLPEIAKYTPAASRLLGNNNLVINQYGTFLNNSNTIKNLVSKAVTKAKLREILRKNLNAGVKKMQAKTKAKQNMAQAVLNKQREKMVANMVTQIMKRVKSQAPKKNLTTRKRTNAAPFILPPKKLNNAGPAPVKKTKPEGYNSYKKMKNLTNAQLNALLRSGLVNESNLIGAHIRYLTNSGLEGGPFASSRYMPALRKYEDPERTGKSTKKTNRKPTNKMEKPTVKKTVGPARPPSPPKPSARAQKPPMSNLLAGTMKPALPGPVLSKKTTEQLIEKAVNAMVQKPKAWTNAQMMNHTYKRGPGFKFGGSDCETKSKDDLVAMLRKYGYNRKPIPKYFTKAVLCQKLKQVHNSYLGLNVNAGNNNYMKEWLKR